MNISQRNASTLILSCIALISLQTGYTLTSNVLEFSPVKYDVSPPLHEMENGPTAPADHLSLEEALKKKN